MRSTRSGARSASGHVGPLSQGSTYTRLPPGVSSLNEAWPSHVSDPAMNLLSRTGRREPNAQERPVRRRRFDPMLCRLAPLAPMLAAAGADGAGAHRLAFYLLLLAIPAAAVAGLERFAAALD